VKATAVLTFHGLSLAVWGTLAIVVGTQALFKVFGETDVVSFRVNLRAEDVNVKELHGWRWPAEP